MEVLCKEEHKGEIITLSLWQEKLTQIILFY